MHFSSAIHLNTLKALRFVEQSKVRNVVVTTQWQELKEWTNVLVGSLDGAGLKEHHFVPQVHKWIANGTNLMKGATYIDALKMKQSGAYENEASQRTKTS